jgi:hypothetical protein
MKPNFIIYIANSFSFIEVLFWKFLNAKLLNIAIINMVGGQWLVCGQYVGSLCILLERMCFWRALRSKVSNQFIEFLHCWCWHITSPLVANFWFCNLLCTVPTYLGSKSWMKFLMIQTIGVPVFQFPRFERPEYWCFVQVFSSKICKHLHHK